MSAVDTRTISRDSLFLMADIRMEGRFEEHRVKVRNLSAGGMMAEGDFGAPRGARVSIRLRNIGWVQGTIAWIQDNRSGIAFAEEIDPKLARAPVTSAEGVDTPRFTKPSSILPPGASVDPARLRKL